MGKEKDNKRTTVLVIIAGCALLLAAVAFGVRDGWFEGKVVLGEEYYGEFTDFNKLSAEEYEGLIEKKDSFIVFVDQAGCETADRTREFVRDWATEKKIKVQRIMFSEMKETSLHDSVRYYPSVVVINEGRVRVFLRADSDADAKMYNDYDSFKNWIEKYL